MVQLDFESPFALASTLQKHANNKQKHIDDIVDFALLMHFDTDPSSVETGLPLDLDLATPPLPKRKAKVGKADVDLDALFKITLQKYFLRDHATGKTLRSILQKLTRIRARTTNA